MGLVDKATGFLNPIAGLAGGLLGTGINAWVASNQNKKQREFDRSMAEYSYSKDLEMFNKANEYNSPKMQMQRFEDAGLNKNLIYSQGQPGQAAVSMPKYQDVKGTFGQPKVDIISSLNAYQNIAMVNRQMDLLAKQIDLAQENVRKTTAEANMAEGMDYDYGAQTIINPDGTFSPKDSIWKYQYDAAVNKSKQTQSELSKAINDAGISEQQLNWAIKKMQTMNDTQINIDKDSILYRQLAEIFAPLLKYVTPKIRKFFTP
nr:MAG: DNA pilot protein [Microvirus sp.]